MGSAPLRRRGSDQFPCLPNPVSPAEQSSQSWSQFVPGLVWQYLPPIREMIVATPLPEQAVTILGPVVTVEWFASQIPNDTRVFAPYTQGLPRSFPTRAAPTPEPPHLAFPEWFRWGTGPGVCPAKLYAELAVPLVILGCRGLVVFKCKKPERRSGPQHRLALAL